MVVAGGQDFKARFLYHILKTKFKTMREVSNELNYTFVQRQHSG